MQNVLEDSKLLEISEGSRGRKQSQQTLGCEILMKRSTWMTLWQRKQRPLLAQHAAVPLCSSVQWRATRCPPPSDGFRHECITTSSRCPFYFFTAGFSLMLFVPVGRVGCFPVFISVCFWMDTSYFIPQTKLSVRARAADSEFMFKRTLCSEWVGLLHSACLQCLTRHRSAFSFSPAKHLTPQSLQQSCILICPWVWASDRWGDEL